MGKCGIYVWSLCFLYELHEKCGIMRMHLKTFRYGWTKETLRGASAANSAVSRPVARNVFFFFFRFLPLAVMWWDLLMCVSPGPRNTPLIIAASYEHVTTTTKCDFFFASCHMSDTSSFFFYILLFISFFAVSFLIYTYLWSCLSYFTRLYLRQNI